MKKLINNSLIRTVPKKYIQNKLFRSFSSFDNKQIIKKKGVYNGIWCGNGKILSSYNPTYNSLIAQVNGGDNNDYESCMNIMNKVRSEWNNTPIPVRGNVVKTIGDLLKENKEDLAETITSEVGKIYKESLGEVQEAIDICYFATGLSRSLNGLVIPSERDKHIMLEKWNPLQGNLGIITAFNFPCAVFFWNSAISLICGNTQIWKPSESTSLIAIKCQKIINEALMIHKMPTGIATMICGDSEIGKKIVDDKRNELISFTGSTEVGRVVNKKVANRFGKTILELGGNNAMIIDKCANLNLAIQACFFGAVGTSGQRCTTLRRIYIHENIYDIFLDKLKNCYSNINIGDPFNSKTLCGPLHNNKAVDIFNRTIKEIEKEGGNILVGGRCLNLDDVSDSAINHNNFVEPTIVEIDKKSPIIGKENFVPIVYVCKISSVNEGIFWNNNVDHGLSSSLFTNNFKEIFKWTGPSGSDCGIVNVNIGPSGAEIGGAFGGEKDTGGGRESGSDSWKQYMRRSTCTINYSNDLPLAQGIEF